MTGFRTAIVLAVCLLAAYSVNLLLVQRSASKRAVLETITHPSGAGDENYFLPATGIQPDTAVGTWEGRPLRVVDREPLELRDAEMLRVGHLDSGTHSVYRSTVEERKDEKLSGFFFLKIGPRAYLKVEQKED